MRRQRIHHGDEKPFAPLHTIRKVPKFSGICLETTQTPESQVLLIAATGFEPGHVTNETAF
jgi:hypothetical protein